MTVQYYEIKSKSIERAFNEYHTETAGAGANITAGDVVKEILALPYPFATREIAKFYNVGKGENNVVIPVKAKVDAAAISSGDYGAIGNTVITFATISVAQDWGVNLQWDRLFAEKANWEVMGPFVQSGLSAIEDKLMGTLCSTLIAAKASSFSTAANSITWANIIAGITSLAVQDFHCDVIIMNPAEYGDLLQIQQFIDASYMGSAENIKTGIIATELGIKFISTTKCPASTVIFLDSRYAAAVGVRRDGKIEEYSYPDTDKYGVVVSEYFGVKVLQTFAVAIGTVPTS